MNLRFARSAGFARLAALATLIVPLCIQPTLAAKLRRLTMEVGEQKAWGLSGEVVRVATANKAIVGVNAVPPKGVVITGMGPGTTMVSAWEAGKSLPSLQYQITVKPASSLTKDAMGTDAQARIDTAGTSLRLSGELSSLERHQSLVESLGGGSKQDSGGKQDGGGLSGAVSGNRDEKSPLVDASRSNFEVQVQLDVKVVEVSRTKLKSSGFYTDRINRGGALSGISGPSNLSGFITNQTTGVNTQLSSTGFIPSTDAFNIFRWGANSLTVFSALESNGFAYTLAEPSLTALSGQTATFLAGGEIPLPFRSGSGSDASISVVYKEFGIRLGMTPTVLDNNRMTIKLAPEVSELDSSLGITAGGLSLPGLRVRRTETTVATGDGETFVISGLVSQQTSANIDKFPFLGDIPILGAFFRSTRFDREDKELLMIVTPHLVRPFAKEAKLPALPGEEVKDYDPGYLRFLFLENGKFTQPDSGYTR